MNRPVLDRRALLAGLVCLPSLPLLGCGSRQRGQTPSEPPPLFDPADDPIADGIDLSSAAAIAASYQSANADPVGPEVVDPLTKNGQLDPNRIRAALRADFEAGRLFVHNGWRLSHTEGRLFTLLARTAS